LTDKRNGKGERGKEIRIRQRNYKEGMQDVGGLRHDTFNFFKE
jgi:hypothetical protein